MAYGKVSLEAGTRAKRQTAEPAPRDQESRPASEYSDYLLDHGPAVLFAAKPGGSYQATYVSANVQRVFGYTAQDFMTPGFFLSRIHPQDLPHFREKRRQLFQNGLSILEFRFRHGDGRYRWVRDDVRVVRDAAGDPLEIVGVATDITHEKEVEAELQESRLQAAAILDNISDALIAVDGEWRCTYFNKPAEPLFARGRQGLLGRRLWEVLPEAVAKELREPFRQALEEQRTTRCDLTTAPDGGVYEVTVQPSAQGLSVFCRDVTGNRRTAKTLRDLSGRLQSEARKLDRILSTVVDHVYTLDRDGRFTYANAAALKALGLDRSGMFGRNWRELGFPVAAMEPFEAQVQQVFAEGRPQSGEFSLPTTTGTRDYEYIIAPLQYSGGEVEAVVATARDVTEKKQMESEWLCLDRLNLVGEMAAGIAHEIRNPMTSVRGFLQLFQEKPEYAGQRAFFNLMIGELDRANAIITEFLSLAKERKMEVAPRDLRRTLEALLPLLAAEAVKSDKQVDAELADVPRVLFDEREICQLVLNLAKNGLEAMAPGGRLGLKLAREGGQVVLSVADTGGGISPDLLDRLGTPFLTTKDRGTGLGLPVCYRIAERHGARLTVDTDPRGTTFHVRFNPHQ